MLESELKQMAQEAWRREHGEQADEIFEDTWQHSTLKKELEAAKERRDVLSALAHVIRSP